MVTMKFQTQENVDDASSKIIRYEQWSPWKSFGKLLNDAILEMGWQERYSALRDIVMLYGKEKIGHLTIDEFLNILDDNPITDKQYRSVFYNLMDRNRDGIVSETEFTSGMLSLSPLATNDPNTSIGQLRLQFIFLYYDTDRNGILNLNELKRMLLHISSIRSLVKNTNSMPESKAREYAIHLIAHYDGVFGFNAFFNSVKNNILKGTGWLLRTHLDLVDFINSDNINNEFSRNEFQNKICLDSHISTNDRMSISKHNHDGKSIINCKNDFKLACSTLKCSPSGSQQSFNPKKKAHEIKNEKHGLIRIISGLKYRSDMKLCKRTIDYYMNISQNINLGCYENEEFLYISNVLDCFEIMELCDQIVEIIRNENSLIRLSGVNNTVRIFGGLYGQLFDLLYLFENFSWPHYQKGDILSMKYIFLGDYIDFGRFSLEVICLLFSFKILYPDRVFLIRGNHEDVSVNVSSGFIDECNKKFGSNGQALWERINDVFEFLSLAVLVNDKVLCLHSGIGKSIRKLEHLENISKPIHVSSDFIIHDNFHEIFESSIETMRILDCLWSEVANSDDQILCLKERDCIDETDVEYNDDQYKNAKFKFGLSDINNFIYDNDIRLIIRTSEYCRNGCESYCDEKLITITSTNTQEIHKCACALVVSQNSDGDLVKFTQILKFEELENTLNLNDDHQKLKKLQVNSEVINGDIDCESSLNCNDLSVAPLKICSFTKSPNISSGNYLLSSPRSGSRIRNIDESPITPAKIKNLYGKPVNLTAL